MLEGPAVSATPLPARASVGHRCPVCSQPGTTFRTARRVAQDLAELERVHAADPGQEPLKLMHGRGTPVEGCGRCGTLWRAQPDLWRSVVRSYEEDRYEPALLAGLQERELSMLERDSPWLAAHGVCGGALLVEVACYVGGFLSFARDRGACVVGIDLNPQMVAWCREQGLDARIGTVGTAGLPTRSFDGVWILNCFDQLPDPHSVLKASARLLRPGGRLVVRTPNASFVRAACAEDADPGLVSEAKRQVLWGMPYLCCYTASALAELMRGHRFCLTTVRPWPSDGGVRIGSRVGPAWFYLVARAPQT